MNSRRKNSAMKSGSFLLLILLVISCVPPTEQIYNEVSVDYKDPGIRTILDLQVEQDLDSLLLFTNDPNPAYRLFAANAFASYQDPAVYDSLVVLLNDPFIEVKSAAVFALGQLGMEKGADQLLEAFSQQDSVDVDNEFNEAILEAMGKIGPGSYLDAIASVSTYRATDTLLVKGQVNAVYQYGLRDVFSASGDQLMLKILTGTYPTGIQKMAAQYFYRFQRDGIAEAKFQLLKVMQEHRDPDMRMALATALTRLGDRELQTAIFDHYSSEADYRVKCNILRQIHKYPYISIVERMLGELSNPNEKIGLCAADYLLNHGNAYDAPVYRQYIKADQSLPVQIRTHQAILKNSGRNSGSRNASTAALKQMYAEGSDYEKAAVLTALSEDPRNYEFLIGEYDEGRVAIVNTRVVEGLVSILKNENYVRFLGNSGGANAKSALADFFQRVMNEGDGGSIAAAVEVFSDKEVGIKDEYEDLSFLKKSLDGLVLPDELETYNALNKVLSEINGASFSPKTSDNIKAINWEIFDQYSARPAIKINTTKGDVEITLFKEEAPQSVINIIELIKKGYYNNKYFHRVVPNFVAQAGCPNGDGYGSLDYTIRSELNNVHYDDEGYVGYASAGLHTESTQWFITYSPTPHLNGKYTIFGKVSAGMDVVHKIGVGDQINRISITN